MWTDKDREEFARILKMERNKAGMSQSALAKKLGVGSTTVFRWEKQYIPEDYEYMTKRIADALGCDVEVFPRMIKPKKQTQTFDAACAHHKGVCPRDDAHVMLREMKQHIYASINACDACMVAILQNHVREARQKAEELLLLAAQYVDRDYMAWRREYPKGE